MLTLGQKFRKKCEKNNQTRVEAEIDSYIVEAWWPGCPTPCILFESVQCEKLKIRRQNTTKKSSENQSVNRSALDVKDSLSHGACAGATSNVLILVFGDFRVTMTS